MAEEPEVETRELQETLQELHEERAERKEEEKEIAWTRLIALSTALLAVVAAVSALESGSLVNEALIERTKAVIQQEQATDQWAYYQAKGTQAAVSAAAVDILLATGKPKVALTWKAEAARLRGRQASIQDTAKAEEKERDRADDLSEQYFHRHHTYALVVTLTQVAIALSAVAALTRRRPVWYLSLLVGFAGVSLFAWALLHGRLV